MPFRKIAVFYTSVAFLLNACQLYQKQEFSGYPTPNQHYAQNNEVGSIRAASNLASPQDPTMTNSGQNMPSPLNGQNQDGNNFSSQQLSYTNVLDEIGKWLKPKVDRENNTPEGDRQPERDSFDLTFEERIRADHASALFRNIVATSPRGQILIDTEPTQAQNAKIKELAHRFCGQPSLSQTQIEEFANAARPLLVNILYEKAKKQGEAVSFIPAKTTIRYDYPAYCLDHNFPAPSSGEQFQLKPVTSLLPKEMIPAYRGLLINTT